MQALARNGYTEADVKKALHAPNRTIAFRYELLDSQNKFKSNLTNVLSGSVANNALAEIKRTARFSLLDDGSINFLSDRIKPYAWLKMQDKPGTNNIASGKTYTKSVSPSAGYPDTNNTEFTDKTIGATWAASMGYSMASLPAGMVDFTIDLGAERWVGKASLHSGGGTPNYRADELEIYISNDNINFSLVGVTSTITNIWQHEIYFTAKKARYVRFRIKKTFVSGSKDFLFIDEGQVYEAVESWISFPLGVFILSTPPRRVDASGVVYREVEAYDLLQVLKDDKVTDRYTVTAGINYITAVKTLLNGAGLTLQNLTATDKTLPADRDWAPGTTKLQIINDLLGAINYRSLWFDENGYAIAQPYVSPELRASEYTYRDDHESVIFPEAEQSLDLFSVPNKWVLVISEPDRPPLISTYTNTNPSSLTSTVSRERTIVDYRQQQEAADQASLDAQAQRLAFEASQVYESVDFETAIMPMHSDSDVFTLEFSRLGISAKYSEQSWSFDLIAGAKMRHSIRRVISI